MVDGSGWEHFIEGPWAAVAAWLGAVLVFVCTGQNAYRHIVNFSRPDLQLHVLRIIVVGPLYIFSAALCLSFPRGACFFVQSVRDIWEAVVIYSFLTLIIEYMGGEHLCLHSICQRDEAVPHLFPLNLCLEPMRMESMIRIPKIGALQFVIIKPVLTIMSLIAYVAGQFENGVYQWTLVIVYNLSYSVALYALMLIYWASHDHQALQAKRPLLKFISVKMIVFLTFWQALLLPNMPLPGHAERWEDFILAMEMVFFALLMNVAFSWQEFQGTGLLKSKRPMRPSHKPPQTPCGAGDASRPRPVSVEELEEGTPEAQGEPAKDAGMVDSPNANAASPQKVTEMRAAKLGAKVIMNPLDIINDASHNFSRRYQQHVLIESAQDHELDSEHQSTEVQTDQVGSPWTASWPEDGTAEQTTAAGEGTPSGPKLSRMFKLNPLTFTIGRRRLDEGAAQSTQDGYAIEAAVSAAQANEAADPFTGAAPWEVDDVEAAQPQRSACSGPEHAAPDETSPGGGPEPGCPTPPDGAAAEASACASHQTSGEEVSPASGASNAAESEATGQTAKQPAEGSADAAAPSADAAGAVEQPRPVVAETPAGAAVAGTAADDGDARSKDSSREAPGTPSAQAC